MVEEQTDRTTKDNKATRYWAGVGFKVREGMRMHKLTGQLEKGPNSWRNVTEHCLVQAGRSETLGKLIGFPEDLLQDMRMGAMLHDFDKKQEMAAIRQANQAGVSPLVVARDEEKIGEDILKTAGFSDRVRRLPSASGGDVPVLVEVQRILDLDNISDEDWAYLIVHYVDDCSIGTDWVSRTSEGRNIVDYRTEQNKAKADYSKITQEMSRELSVYPRFKGMNNLDAMSFVSHQIEQRLAQRIKEKTGEDVDPLTIPELVDQKIRESIETTKNSNNRA